MSAAPARRPAGGPPQRGEDVLRRLAAPDALAPAYFLLGDHVPLRDRLLARLRDLAVPPEWRDTNAETLWAADVTEAEAADLARTPPFGAPRRGLTVRGVEAWRGAGERKRRTKKVKAETGSPLAEALGEASATTVVVVTGETWDAGRWAGDPLFDAVLAGGVVAVCEAPHAEALLAWLRDEARAQGVTLEPAAAAELVERAGEEPLRLVRELEKLAAYAGAGRAVSVEDVLAVTGELAPPSVFQFLDVLFVERRRGPALRLLGRLLADSHPLQLHAMLTTQLRKLVLLKSAMARGLPTGQIAGTVKLPFSLVPRLGMIARRTPPERFAALLAAFAGAEASLKRGGDGRTVLEGLVLEVCR